MNGPGTTAGTAVRAEDAVGWPQDEPNDADLADADREDGQATPSPRRPVWRYFDERWYLARHPGAAEAVLSGLVADAEQYYADTGCRLGHSPNMFFDEAWYLQAYPDVAAQLAPRGARTGVEH